jgi:hypothetical protein
MSIPSKAGNSLLGPVYKNGTKTATIHETKGEKNMSRWEAICNELSKQLTGQDPKKVIAIFDLVVQSIAPDWITDEDADDWDYQTVRDTVKEAIEMSNG